MKKQPFTLIMINKYILSILIVLLIVCCTTASKYEKLIDTEMSKDIRHDSIFLGFNFGAPKSDFFIVCKELNSKRLIVQADKSGFVQYFFPPKTATDKDLKVLLWGTFNKAQLMTGLKFEFSHIAWAPWNEASKPDNLIPVIQTKLLEWFPGNDFVDITSKDKDDMIWVKIDGNRRIVIEAPDNVTSVKVNIDDLRYLVN